VNPTMQTNELIIFFRFERKKMISSLVCMVGFTRLLLRSLREARAILSQVE
jgi:hypothetical protein